MAHLAQLLVIGVDPYRAGPYDPEPVAQAVAAAMQQFADHDIGAQSCSVGVDGSEDVEATITAALTSAAWQCVLIGGGLRVPPEQLPLFERVVNLVHRHAPQATIVFNTSLTDIYEAGVRGLTR